MKLKCKDIETIIRWLEERRSVLKESIKETFVSLKNSLKVNNWDVAIVDCETLIECLTDLATVEIVLDKIKAVVEK